MTETDTFSALGCFALLDDQQAEHAASRLYTEHVGTLSIAGADTFDDAFTQLQAALARGLHAVSLLSFELGCELHGLAARPEVQPSQILLFENCARLSQAEVNEWLAKQTQTAEAQASAFAGAGHAGITGVSPHIRPQDFDAALARLHRYIEAGDCYQVNYTYRLHFQAYGSPLALYRRLRARQPVPFGALIGLPDGRAVLSLSPELFVQHTEGLLEARPMKGTAPASAPHDAAKDQRRAIALASDPKNRAENVMIVDLLRNDLGRVAEPGSVTVPQRFEVARFGQVLQMTSTVQARLRPGATLAELLRAVFPCGSIVGAPKRRALQIIRELEPDARSLYTGAIGWFDPAPAKSLNSPPSFGDFCLSVPIRTLLLEPPQVNTGSAMRVGQMGVGAGIVHDSQAQDEWEECALKARFLTGLTPEFELFETMHASQAEGCRHVARHLPRHLARLEASARHFGFAWDATQIREALQAACAAMPSGQAHRLRLALKPDGTCTVQTAPLHALEGPVHFVLADESTEAGDPFLAHKTTLRTRYDAAWKSAEAAGAFDKLFFNADGELTEGGRSNVLVKLNGRWYTPPLASGVLPGVMRAVLLDDPAWAASERRLSRSDLLSAEEVVLCNALRGAMPASLLKSAPLDSVQSVGMSLRQR